MASVMAMSPGDGAMHCLALLVGLVTAVIIGLINGFLIAFVGVFRSSPPSMMTLINGLNVLISGGTVISGFPPSLLWLGNGNSRDPDAADPVPAVCVPAAGDC